MSSDRGRPRVALTCSPGRLEGLDRLLREHGFEVSRHPLVTTVPRTDEQTVQAAARLLTLPWMLVTSRSTVEAFAAMGLGLGGPRLAAIGLATARAIATAGVTAELVAVPENAAGLARNFLAHPEARGPVALPRGNRALGTLDELLGEAGVAAFPLVVYDTASRPWNGAAADAIVLSSPSAVEALPEEVGRGCGLVTLGGTTTEAVRRRGWRCQQADGPTPEAALAAIERVTT